jgi:hypothetical protein
VPAHPSGFFPNMSFSRDQILEPGYIPGGEAVQAVGNLASQLKTERLAQADGSDLVYVLDRKSASVVRAH